MTIQPRRQPVIWKYLEKLLMKMSSPASAAVGAAFVGQAVVDLSTEMPLLLATTAASASISAQGQQRAGRVGRRGDEQAGGCLFQVAQHGRRRLEIASRPDRDADRFALKVRRMCRLHG